MKVSKFFGIVFLVCAFIFATASSCQGPQAIVSATARDTVFSAEKRANGAYVMWLTHDDVGTYCTTDTSIGDKGIELMKSGRDALVTYKTLNVNDAENGILGITQGACNTDRGSGNNTNYVVTAIEVAPPITGTIQMGNGDTGTIFMPGANFWLKTK